MCAKPKEKGKSIAPFLDRPVEIPSSVTASDARRNLESGFMHATVEAWELKNPSRGSSQCMARLSEAHLSVTEEVKILLEERMRTIVRTPNKQDARNSGKELLNEVLSALL